MKLENIIFVEDNLAHQEDIKTKFGEDVRLAKTYLEFEREFEKGNVSGILSDLYFPTGFDIGSTEYIKHKTQILDVLKTYIDNMTQYEIVRYSELAKITEDMICDGEIFKEELLVFLNDKPTPYEFYKHIKELTGIEEVNDMNREYINLKMEIEKDSHLLPMGIQIYSLAKESGLPCIIVTDSNHHGKEFQPFVSNVGTYYDKLTDGKKMWGEAQIKLVNS